MRKNLIPLLITLITFIVVSSLFRELNRNFFQMNEFVLMGITTIISLFVIYIVTKLRKNNN